MALTLDQTIEHKQSEEHPQAAYLPGDEEQQPGVQL